MTFSKRKKTDENFNMLAAKNENQEEKKGSKQFFMSVAKVFSILVLLLILIYFVSLISGFDPFFDLSANNKLIKNLKDESQDVKVLFRNHFDNLAKVAEEMSFATSKRQVDDVIYSYIGNPKFGDLRYFCKGKEYSADGLLIENESIDEILKFVNSNVPGCTDIYYNDTMSFDCISLYMPVRGSDYVDGVLSIIQARNLIDVSDILSEQTAVLSIISSDGRLLESVSNKKSPFTPGNNYFDYITSLTRNPSDKGKLMEMVHSKGLTANQFKINGQKYTIGISPVEGTYGNLFVVNMSNSDELISEESTYIRQIIVVSIISIIALIVSMCIAFAFFRSSTKSLIKASLTAPGLGCANEEQFKKSCMDIIYGNEPRKRILVVTAIRQFNYISNEFGEEISNEILLFLSKVISGMCSEGETYGYANDGRFMVLLDYSNEDVFKDKIGLLSAIVSKNQILSDKNISLNLLIGACATDENKKRTLKQIIENATEAMNLAKSNLQMPYVIYNDKVAQENLRAKQVETQMEDALKNREFRVFFQPKYSVRNDRIDSAEALVRWFDPQKNDYIFPGEFIPLFESNGFITKLDHYVFIEVCKYFANAVEKGEKVVPVSVNVSRVTAMENDFLNFYIGNKKKYGIADGYLCVELTESFAMQDYESMKNLVIQLRKNGIGCSLDDFGTGYSSFNILKHIQLDELKLDRFFIEDGANRSRDDLLIKTVINLAQNMNMKVVQEGVETKEIFDRVVGMGCDVIQGFYYAKAITLEEYRIFLKSNTSIKYKSLVK